MKNLEKMLIKTNPYIVLLSDNSRSSFNKKGGVVGVFLKETEKAFNIRVDDYTFDGKSEWFWFPKSQIVDSFKESENGGSCSVVLRDWVIQKSF